VCGAQKLVCTTVQPIELYNWHGAADFVVDYLNFIPPQPSHEQVSTFIHRVSKKRPTFTTCYNFYTHSSIATVFGINVAEKVGN